MVEKITEVSERPATLSSAVLSSALLAAPDTGYEGMGRVVYECSTSCRHLVFGLVGFGGHKSRNAS